MQQCIHERVVVSREEGEEGGLACRHCGEEAHPNTLLHIRKISYDFISFDASGVTSGFIDILNNDNHVTGRVWREIVSITNDTQTLVMTDKQAHSEQI